MNFECQAEKFAVVVITVEINSIHQGHCLFEVFLGSSCDDLQCKVMSLFLPEFLVMGRTTELRAL